MQPGGQSRVPSTITSPPQGLTITDPVANALFTILTGAGLVLLGWFFLVFPSGRFVPRWGRWCVLAAAATLVLVLPSLVKVRPTPDDIQPIGAGLLLLDAAAQVYRYRRISNPTERQQTKWVVLGVAACVAVFVGTRILFNLVGLLAVHHPSQVAQNITGSSVIVGFACIPVCIGIAVLHTHLWDIGLVISRTLTYAVVTALLAGVYAGLVLLATRVLPFHNAVAVAVSTLATAAIFNPLRHRVQRAVDRRFNRARYDADQAVAARLQDAADPDAVHAHLLGAVHQALEPAHASVWIRQR
jgi:hypothetical protein